MSDQLDNPHAPSKALAHHYFSRAASLILDGTSNLDLVQSYCLLALTSYYLSGAKHDPQD